MSVSLSFIAEQGPTLKALGRTALAIAGHGRSDATTPFAAPGAEVQVSLPPRSSALIDAYVRHVGGQPTAYRGVVPPHMFPQWAFEPLSRTLAGCPYPLAKVMNGGCSFVVNAPLRRDEELEVTAQLVDVDDDGTRAVLRQRVVTGTRSAPNALVAEVRAFVPLAQRERGAKRAPARVPADANEIAFWRLRPDAGRDFAVLTGDFNPVHWIAPYARASGFKTPILHGFATLARAIESANRVVFSGTTPIRSMDCRFVRPVALPGRVGVYLSRDAADAWQLRVGDAPGGALYMDSTFSTHTAPTHG
ncbi:MAG: MaoC family dehydratase [Myxococcales bacterium]|nr:MaoC family dehydratase [Myxococcales bacterium]